MRDGLGRGAHPSLPLAASPLKPLGPMTAVNLKWKRGGRAAAAAADSQVAGGCGRRRLLEAQQKLNALHKYASVGVDIGGAGGRAHQRHVVEGPRAERAGKGVGEACGRQGGEGQGVGTGGGPVRRWDRAGMGRSLALPDTSQVHLCAVWGRGLSPHACPCGCPLPSCHGSCGCPSRTS
jgi:hypothetical protein